MRKERSSDSSPLNMLLTMGFEKKRIPNNWLRARKMHEFMFYVLISIRFTWYSYHHRGLSHREITSLDMNRFPFIS